MGGFNTTYYKFQKTTNPEHTRAVIKMYELATDNGWKAVGTPNNEIQIPEFIPDKGNTIGWPMDVFVRRWNPKVDGGWEYLDIEVDGESHGKRGAKDEHRDEVIALWAKMYPGLRSVRIKKDEIVGSGAQSDAYLIKKAGL